ncbi:MAG: Sulfatase-modifying factor enzyme 1 [Lacunisphaera sp.]|nr:Sulfatase-modifying factor enzyme 1 [Lacunisphaera sp.]
MNYDKEPELPDAARPAIRHRWIAAILILVALAVAGIFVYRQVIPLAAVMIPPTADQKHLVAQISFREERLQILATQLAKLGDNPPADAARRLIEEAVRRQNELMRLRPNPQAADAVRLNDWQLRLGDTNARDGMRQSGELEAASVELLKQKQIPAGVEKLKEALRLQREVNGGLANPTLKNYGREARLEQETERLEAEPMRAEIARLLAAARETAAAGRWTDALGFYDQARDLQLKLNHDYARTRFIDLLAVEHIDAERATLSATEAHGQMEALLKQAAAAGTPGEADQLLATAAARQKLINEQFAKSRFVSLEQLEQIEITRQTWRAQAALDTVRDLDRQAAEHLRKRELFQAQQLIGSALEKLETTIAEQPKARGVDEELRQRLGYLNLRRADLVQIQDQTYDLLRPLPGREQFALLKTETPQELFTRVMNNNPSRNPGRDLPVDSVTYAEAGEFCRRLGWALGAPVRLPTATEFHAAVGNAAATVTHAWGAENTPGKSQVAGGKPANPAGFHDLLGNLAEWVGAGAGDTAQLAGGSFAESRAQLQAEPLRNALKTERARTNGFRVVVELDLARPK